MKLFDFVIVILLLLGAAALVCAENPYRVQVAANPYTVVLATGSGAAGPHQQVSPAAPPGSPWVQPHSTRVDPWPAIKAECLRTGQPVMVWVRFADRMAWQRMSGANHVHLDEDFWDKEGPGVWVIRPWQGHCYAMGFVKADDCTDAMLLRLAGLPVHGQNQRPVRRIGGWGMSEQLNGGDVQWSRVSTMASNEIPRVFPSSEFRRSLQPVQRAAVCST